MKKLIFFVPAILFTFFYGFIILVSGTVSLNPIVIVWLASMWIAGILLNRESWWGGLIGTIPGLCFIYMGTQDTGQIIKETPIGIVVLLFYVGCSLIIYKNNR